MFPPDDRTTIVAISVLAFIVADVAHETLGHGIGYFLGGGISGIFTTTRVIRPRRSNECVNREIFYSLKEAQIAIEKWRGEYNRRAHLARSLLPFRRCPLVLMPETAVDKDDLPARWEH